MSKQFILIIYLLFLSSSFQLHAKKNTKKRSPFRGQSSLIISPLGGFTYKPSRKSEKTLAAESSIGFHQDFTYRVNDYFGFGIAGATTLFFKKQTALSNTPTIERDPPKLYEITIPLRGYYPLTKRIELQAFVESGISFLSIPGPTELGFGPNITPGAGIQILLNASSNLALTFHTAYSMSWISLDSPTKNISLTKLEYLQFRLGFSFDPY